MKGTELCLLGAKGKANSLIQSHKVRQLVEAIRDRTKHSAKPNEVRKRIVQLMGDIPRIELFARGKTPGWDVWGNEVDSDIQLNENLPRISENRQKIINAAVAALRKNQK